MTNQSVDTNTQTMYDLSAMPLALGFPGKYIQGPDTIDSLGKLTLELGSKTLILADQMVKDLHGERILREFDRSGIQFRFELFGGECCRSEISRIVEIGSATDAEVVIAVGGGKTLDTGKAVASSLNAHTVAVPTIASTDAPVSSIAVEYSEDHTHIGVMRFPRNPSLVVVDSRIIAQAPPRFLVAGMGDAIATGFEAKACAQSQIINFSGGHVSPVALALSQMCYNTILEFGVAAKQAVETQQLNDAVERIIEANIFLSGVGFENTGVAAAHATDGAISRFESSHDSQHGERVALGVLFQLTLEGGSEPELERLLDFYDAVGLPRSFAEIGLPGLSDADISELASLILRKGSPIRNMPMDLSLSDVVKALEVWR